MLVWSGAFHVAMAVLLVALTWRHGPYRHVSPVAVVDLVGGEGLFRPPAAAPRAAPASRTSRSSSRQVKKDSARAERARPLREKAAPPPSAKPAATEAPKVETKPEPAAAPPPDTASVSEAIRKIRQDRSESARVREEIEKMRHASAAQSAIRNVRERVAHRVDLSSLRPTKEGPPAQVAGTGAATGNVKLPPEYLEYFRALDEKVRSAWIPPGLKDEEMKRLMVQLRITIEKDGKVLPEEIRIEKSSGNRYFDDSVNRAIQKSSPLPIPPEKLRGGEDHYQVGFRFYGSGGMP